MCDSYISYERLRTSAYINCLKRHLNWDNTAIVSFAYLISYYGDDTIADLSMFKWSEKGVTYDGEPENINSNNCEKYIPLAKKLNENFVKKLANKLFIINIEGDKLLDNEEIEVLKEIRRIGHEG